MDHALKPATADEQMQDSLRTGISFGMTSAVITTLGLMIGLHSGSHSKTIVLGGILTIAIADAFSDALGIHVSEEAENVHTPRQIWGSTLATFLTKFIFGLTFAIPVLLLPLSTAIVAALVWGFSILAVLSYVLGRRQGGRPWQVVAEHLIVAFLVIGITHWVGNLIAKMGS
jgi:VIT1/CCC1 family predicted Fe2+/Mn2+ transporter